MNTKYKKIEYRRNCCQIFWSIFRTDYNFLKIFSCLMKYKIYIIEIMIYLNSLIISIIINLAFYTDRTMHKIYDNEGNYNLLNSLPQILISNISMEIISFGFEKLIDFQDKLIDLKNNLGISERETEEREKEKEDKNLIYRYKKILTNIESEIRKSENSSLNVNLNLNKDNLINNLAKYTFNLNDCLSGIELIFENNYNYNKYDIKPNFTMNKEVEISDNSHLICFSNDIFTEFQKILFQYYKKC